MEAFVWDTDSTSSSTSCTAFESCDTDEEEQREADYYELSDQLFSFGYTLRRSLGRGGYAIVYLCEHPATQAVRAVKVMESSKNSQQRELEANENLREKLHHRSRNADTQASNTSDEGAHICLHIDHFTIKTRLGSQLCLVYPLLGPRLHRIPYRRLPQRDDPASYCRSLAAQVTDALVSLHKVGICHADFRPSNILLGLDLETVQVIDFGQSYDTTTGPRPDRFGIPLVYAAPEVVFKRRQGGGNQQMDLWSLACTLYELRVGSPPFVTGTPSSPSKEWECYLGDILPLLGAPGNITQGTTLYSLPPCFCKWHCEEARETREFGMVVRTVEERKRRIRDDILGSLHKRTSVAEASDLADLLEGLWRWDPEERLTAEAARAHRWFSTEYPIAGYKKREEGPSCWF